MRCFASNEGEPFALVAVSRLDPCHDGVGGKQGTFDVPIWVISVPLPLVANIQFVASPRFGVVIESKNSQSICLKRRFHRRLIRPVVAQ